MLCLAQILAALHCLVTVELLPVMSNIICNSFASTVCLLHPVKKGAVRHKVAQKAHARRMLYCMHRHRLFVHALHVAVLIAEVLWLQVRELLQHRTGATALAQQTAGTRNAVEVLGLQKVYRSSKSRHALAHLDAILQQVTK